MAPESQAWLVRHGETEWSRDHRHTSITDLDLTPRGEDVARSLAPRLGRVSFDLVLASPRRRARKSAELAGFPTAVVDEDLAEWGYGDYEGVTTAEIRTKVPGWTVWTHPSPGGESPEAVTARVDRVIARVRACEGHTLIFGHGHALRALTARWLGLPITEGRLFLLDTATVSVLGCERDQSVIAKWNG